MRFWIQMAAIALVVVYCWRRGGQPERAAATVLPAIPVLDLVYHAIWGEVTTYDRINVGHVVIDVAALLAWLIIALRANRWWTLWLVSAQLVAVLAHFLRGVTSEMHPWVYAAMNRGPSWLEIALLFVGTTLYRRRSRARSKPSPSS
jgi:hypothetical protein